MKQTANKKVIAAIAAVVLVVCALAACGTSGSTDAQKSWAQEYMADAANYVPEFSKLPADYAAWQAWSAEAGDIDKLTDNEGSGLGENRLGTLAGTYSMLAKINIAAPGNQECQSLFEQLSPYYEKAFVWEADTTAEECIKRLKDMSDEDTMAAIDSLAQQVAALYEAEEVDKWFTLVTGGDLQMLPQRPASDSDLQVNP